jgi:hypothetical protein
MVSITRVSGALVVLMVMFIGRASGAGAGADTGAGTGTGRSNGTAYTVTSTSVDPGDGWRVEVGQLSGGDTAVSAAFNAASVASGKTMDGMLNRDKVLRDDATFEAKPAISFRPTVISQVLTGVYFHQGAAHPLDYVSTVVIDSRTARPITLEDLFVDQQAGLNRLSEQTKLLFPTVYSSGKPMPGESGNAPVAENFHNWIPTVDGLEIHFEDYQFGHGLPVITVPWSQLTNVLAPAMQMLAR